MSQKKGVTLSPQKHAEFQELYAKDIGTAMRFLKIEMKKARRRAARVSRDLG